MFEEIGLREQYSHCLDNTVVLVVKIMDMVNSLCKIQNSSTGLIFQCNFHCLLIFCKLMIILSWINKCFKISLFIGAKEMKENQR